MPSNAIITKLIAGTYEIFDKETKVTYISKPRGILKYQGSSPKVGDLVLYDIIDESKKTAIITKILPRKNDLIRPYISNIDQAFVIFSVKEPDLNLNLLDKFLVTLEYNNIKPIIIFSKWDLLKEVKQEELDEINKVISYYESIGYTIIKTSINEDLKNSLLNLFKDKISVLTGQSGVGKSSLLNVLDPTINLETNEISESLNRGKHTTRHVELYKLFDGMIADTPGFGTLEFTDIDEQTLAQNFTDFFRLSSECKYNGCLHINEPGCKVKKEVESGNILKSRYENYLSFIQTIKETPKKY